MLPLGSLGDPGERAVTGVTHDSRQVRPGDLYIALPGATTHGARYVAQALDAGAVAVLTDPTGAALAEPLVGPVGDASPVPVIVLDHPRAWAGEVAAAVYGYPARDLVMLGVTGTNGKTTTTFLLEAGLRQSGLATGLIGTVQTRVGDEVVDSVRTTPEATDVHALLAVMRERGVGACAMEVSSHALAFGRVDGIVFDVVGFTNLSQDHLDFHRDLDDYFATKCRLFHPSRARRAVVCVGDEYGRRLARELEIPGSALSVWAGETERVPGGGDDDTSMSRPAELAAAAPEPLPESLPMWRVSAAGSGWQLASPAGPAVPLEVPLPGDFNVTNAALAVAMLGEAGIDAGLAAAGVAACTGVPGRMENVEVSRTDTPAAVVDYAHTPDAVQNVLRALRRRPVAGGRERPDVRAARGGRAGRLIAVVGAGGDRDREKRGDMGMAAARHADVVVVTDDNPRSEDPAAIRATVLAGAQAVPPDERAHLVEVADRRAAIRAALEHARGPQDTVAVLGKGHEQGQEMAGTVHPFDDRAVLREELARWRT